MGVAKIIGPIAFLSREHLLRSLVVDLVSSRSEGSYIAKFSSPREAFGSRPEIPPSILIVAFLLERQRPRTSTGYCLFIRLPSVVKKISFLWPFSYVLERRLQVSHLISGALKCLRLML